MHNRFYHEKDIPSREKFLGYATEKFGIDITFSLAKHKIALMYIQLPANAIDHLPVSAHELRQHEIEGNKWR